MPSQTLVILTILGVLCFCVRPTVAYGAGNIASISSVEGINYRHGDICDVILTLTNAKAFGGFFGGKKFSKLDVSRIYFGNFLRDYSQAIDVASLKHVSAEAVTLVIWVLAFMSFGYGTKEFEVTRERLGTYLPIEHVDNPKGYADGEDARTYDKRLRPPVDERRELTIDPRTGMKNYIANEDAGCGTSSFLCKQLIMKVIDLGRRYKKSKNDDEYYDALRLLGTACHALEDFLAHSNYTELVLIELGERGVFPHVGTNTQMRIQGVNYPVWPLTTGTFGGVDFLHSVMGGFSDNMTQSEIGDLDGLVANAQKQDTSKLKALLMKIPSGILGGSNEANTAEQLQQNAQAQQMGNMNINTQDANAFTRQCEQIRRQMKPILEFHDRIMKAISSAINKIPILPDLLDKVSEQLNIWVFSLIAPFILPIIREVKKEVEGGSTAVIKTSKDAQHIVFNDPRSTDPTHSMLSKDHFSNVLNEPSGKAATAVVAWLVPQVVEAWDDDRIDPRRTAMRIVDGVLHHPAQRGMGNDGASEGRMIMFSRIEHWWKEMKERDRQELRSKLSREGVRMSRHHKDGVNDCGHGSGKPIGMPGIGKPSGGAYSQGPIPQQRPQQHQQSSTAAPPSNMADKLQAKLGAGALGALAGSLLGSKRDDQQQPPPQPQRPPQQHRPQHAHTAHQHRPQHAHTAHHHYPRPGNAKMPHQAKPKQKKKQHAHPQHQNQRPAGEAASYYSGQHIPQSAPYQGSPHAHNYGAPIGSAPFGASMHPPYQGHPPPQQGGRPPGPPSQGGYGPPPPQGGRRFW